MLKQIEEAVNLKDELEIYASGLASLQTALYPNSAALKKYVPMHEVNLGTLKLHCATSNLAH
jgi:hypothetical protein